MATIIDSLLVTLGLDTKPYDKARKESERQQRNFKDNVKKGGNEIADALTGVARAAAVMFLGFEGVKGAIEYFAGLNVANANLGRFSKNIGQNVHEVNTWDSAVELAGGSATEAATDLGNLSASITALKATGTVSPLLLLLQRMGVSIYDAQGKTKKLTDIYVELGNKFQKFNRADAYNLARQAGISEGTFNLIRAESAERDHMLRTAEQNNALTEENAKQAAELQSEWRAIGQAIKGAATSILAEFTPPLMEAFAWIQKVFNGLKGNTALAIAFRMIGGLVHSLIDLTKLAFNGISLIFKSKPAQWIERVLGKLLGFSADVQSSLNDALDEKVKEAEAANAAADVKAPAKADDRKGTIRRSITDNNNPGNLRFVGQAGAQAGVGGFAAFPTLSAGINAANEQLDRYAKRGINTISSIVSKWAPVSENDTASYIADLEKKLGVGRNQQLSGADRQRLLQAIFAHEGVNKVSANDISAALKGNPAALQAMQFASANSAPGASGAAGGKGSTTSVQIDNIEVNTQATDAQGIAAALPDALKRKGIVAQADSGMS